MVFGIETQKLFVKIIITKKPQLLKGVDTRNILQGNIKNRPGRKGFSASREIKEGGANNEFGTQREGAKAPEGHKN